MYKRQLAIAFTVVVICAAAYFAYIYDKKIRCMKTYANPTDYLRCLEEQKVPGYLLPSVTSADKTISEMSDEEFQQYIDDRTAPMKTALEQYKTEIAGKCEGVDYSSPCFQAIILKDEVSKSSTAKMSAQKIQQNVYAEAAKKLTDQELIKVLKDEFDAMSSPGFIFQDALSKINLNLSLGVHLWEADQRHPKDPFIETINFSMVDKFSPCWGIPYGWCLE